MNSEVRCHPTTQGLTKSKPTPMELTAGTSSINTTSRKPAQKKKKLGGSPCSLADWTYTSSATYARHIPVTAANLFLNVSAAL